MIQVKKLNKSFKVYQKEPGLKGSVKALFKRAYFEKMALKEVNLEIASGEIIGLVGSNGAGKTTLVKILSGIIAPESGEISVLGFNPWERKNAYRKQLSLIMGQKAQLWWDLPAYDGFLLLKEIYEIPKKNFLYNLEELSSNLEIKEQLKVPIRKLSLGERMKVELMAALLHEPKVIFLDEPTIGLDITAQKNVRKFLREYREEKKPTIILTSHYMEDIEELCPRVALIRDGEIIYDGSLEKIANQFSDLKTLQFDFSAQEKSAVEKLLSESEITTSYQFFDNQVRIKMQRDDVNEQIKFLLDKCNPANLKVLDVDVADAIESHLINAKNS